MGQEKKIALITGAGRGIGKVIALQLAKSGADIALTDLNPELEDLKSELNKLGSKCLDFQVDVTGTMVEGHRCQPQRGFSHHPCGS